MKRLAPDIFFLSGIAPFDGLSARELAQLTEHVDRLHVPEGTTLAHAGESAYQFLQILRGEVWSHDGVRRARLEPPSQLGGDELLSGQPHARTLVAGVGLELLVVNGPAYRWVARSLTDRHAVA